MRRRHMQRRVEPEVISVRICLCLAQRSDCRRVAQAGGDVQRGISPWSKPEAERERVSSDETFDLLHVDVIVAQGIVDLVVRERRHMILIPSPVPLPRCG